MTVRNHFPPVFATNRPARDETVAEKLNLLFSESRVSLASPPALAIATAYLNPAGFVLLADELEQAPRIRLLLGAEPDVATSQRTEPPLTRQEVAQAVAHHEEWLNRQRDLTGFTRAEDDAARRMVAWLRQADESGTSRVEVRRYTQGFLHGKAYIVDDDYHPHVLAGSSNLTYAGLCRNAELNLGYPASEHTHLVREWFTEMWETAEPFDLPGLYEKRWEPHTPWVVFLRMLWELYGDTSADDTVPTLMNLTGFQREGVARMLRILEQLGGVIVADEVGLGKTFMAAEIMRRATEKARQQVLVVSPAALKTGMWEPFLRRYDLSRRIDVMSYEELRNRWQDQTRDSEDFRRRLDEYALVVVDEAHNLRNPDTQRAETLNALLGGSNPKQLVLLTATPVNNSLSDLEYLIRYFVRNDARFAEIGIPSISGYIKHAHGLDPDSLSPEHLYDLIDQVAVRRTRRFIRTHYAGDAIQDEEGNTIRIVFPEPKLHRLDYEMDELGDQLVDAVVFALEEDGDELRYEQRRREPGRLMLSRYTPGAYTTDNRAAESFQVANAGLLRSGLLKRLESSPAALASTLGRLIDAHWAFLTALSEGYVVTGEALSEWTSSDTDEFDDFLQKLDEKEKAQVDPRSNYHFEDLIEDVNEDLEILKTLKALADQANEGLDAKAKALVERLRTIAEEASRPSAAGLSSGDRRKTIVFSTFADTVRDVHENVLAAIEAAPADDPLATFKGRVAEPIFGSKVGIDQQARARTLARFAPETAGVGGEPDTFDLLFTTDVLSEGVNLQQAGRIVNYDLPWNPMRVVQRHGRIDRIGSKHRYVYLDCFFPADNLDRLLHLQSRLHRKLAQADAAVGVGAVLPGFSGSEGRVFNDTEDQIRRLADEDASFLVESGGTSALSGEEYRRRLQKAVGPSTLGSTVRKLPYGAGSGFINPNVKGQGYTFCARIDGVEKPVFRFVFTDDSWHPLLDDFQKPVVEPQTLIALSAADPGSEATGRDLPDEAYDGAFEAWEIAHDHILSERNRLADPAALQPQIPKPLRDAANLVSDHGGFLGSAVQQDLYKRLNSVPPRKTWKPVRDVLSNAATGNHEKVELLRKLADDEGLEAPPPPPHIEPVDPTAIHLVTWMAVSPASPKKSDSN